MFGAKVVQVNNMLDYSTRLYTTLKGFRLDRIRAWYPVSAYPFILNNSFEDQRRQLRNPIVNSNVEETPYP
jgi:hypothetical protein